MTRTKYSSGGGTVFPREGGRAVSSRFSRGVPLGGRGRDCSSEARVLMRLERDRCALPRPRCGTAAQPVRGLVTYLEPARNVLMQRRYALCATRLGVLLLRLNRRRLMDRCAQRADQPDQLVLVEALEARWAEREHRVALRAPCLGLGRLWRLIKHAAW